MLLTAKELDATLRDLVALGKRVDAEVALALAEMKRRKLHLVYGYSRIQDYAAWELEVPKAKALALIEIAKKLPALPEIARAFAEGKLAWTKARLIVRVATAETQEHWLDESERLSVRGLESAVARKKGEPVVVRRVLELTPQQDADLEQLVRQLREERGEAIPFSEAVVELARRSAAPPVDAAAYQIVIHDCPSCERATRVVPGGEIEVATEELAVAKREGDVLDMRPENGPTGKFTRAITPAERRAVVARDRGQCVICGSMAWRHIHHVERVDGDPGVLCLLCFQCHQKVVHGGHITVTGRAPWFVFKLRDGRPARVRGARGREAPTA